MFKRGLIILVLACSIGIISAQLPGLEQFFQQAEETATPPSTEIDLSQIEQMMDLTSNDILQLKNLPAPVITVVTPEAGGYYDIYAVSVGTSFGNKILHETEIILDYISSHFSGTVGVGGGLGGSFAAGFGVTVYDGLYHAFQALKKNCLESSNSILYRT